MLCLKSCSPTLRLHESILSMRILQTDRRSASFIMTSIYVAAAELASEMMHRFARLERQRKRKER